VQFSGKVALVATPIVRRSGADAAAKGRSQPSRQSPNVSPGVISLASRPYRDNSPSRFCTGQPTLEKERRQLYRASLTCARAFLLARLY
jgi:hypothetical protein